MNSSVLPVKFEITAYHKSLLQRAGSDEGLLACLLFMDVVQDKNPLALDLLALTGDAHYTEKTFRKAAKILITLNTK